MASTQSSPQILAERYSGALLELAATQQAVDKIDQELALLSKAVNDNESLQVLMTNPLLKRADQEKAMTAILEASGASKLLQNFLGLLAQKRRLALLPAIAARFSAMLRQSRGESTAIVTVAREISADQKALLEKTILERFKLHKLRLDIRIDPEVLGGLRVRLGSVEIDDTLRAKLNQLALQMKGSS